MFVYVKIVVHCNGNSVYIFIFWELRGLSPDFHIHVPVSDLYIPRIGPHISSSRKGRPIVGLYNSLTDTWMWKLGLRPRYSFPGNICLKFSSFCLCSVDPCLVNTLSPRTVMKPNSWTYYFVEVLDLILRFMRLMFPNTMFTSQTSFNQLLLKQEAE